MNRISTTARECFDVRAVDGGASPEDATLCGAFELYARNELHRFEPTATSHDEIQRQYADFHKVLHQEFVAAGLCLVVRAETEEATGNVSIYKNPSAGQYGECPIIVERKAATLN